MITDKVVVARTGSSMEDWFRHFDSLGAAKLNSHDLYELAASIDGLKSLGEWNIGLLSTSYQWSRGLRERGQKEGGFEVSVSKTINALLSEVYHACVNVSLRRHWLDEDIEITKKTENKSVRALWVDGVTRLSMDFYSKGDTKSQIVVQHLKLPDASAFAAMKQFWSERLDILKGLLENKR